MKRSLYTLTCLIFSLLIFSLIWIWPSNPSQIKRIAQKGDASYAKDIRIAGFINDPGKDNEMDLTLEFKAYQDKGLVPNKTLNQYQPYLSAYEETLGLFPLWNRPSRLGNLNLLNNQTSSLWLDDFQFGSQGLINYTLINKEQPSYKQMSYQLKHWTPSIAYYHTISYAFSEQGLHLLLGLYNAHSVEENDYFNSFILLTLDPETGQVKEETSHQGQIYFDYFPNIGLSANYLPAYHIVQPYLSASPGAGEYHSQNGISAGALVQIFDSNLNLLAELNAADYQADNFLIWSKEDRIYFLAGKGMIYSGPNSMEGTGQEVKLSLYEYQVDQEKAHKITDIDFKEAINNLQVFKGNIHIVTNPQDGKLDQKKHLVLDPDLNQIVYEATWQAIHPDHPILLLRMETKY